MKDLTHYFTSPTKSQEMIVVNNQVNTNESTIETAEKSEKSETTAVLKKKRGRKKKIRKPSDPAVTTISELLSNNLSLISPNNSYNESVKENIDTHTENTDKQTENNVENGINEPATEDSEIVSCELNVSVTKDAFSFMMEARAKSIGMNSEGKDKEELSPKSKENKEKIMSRKNLLQNWADSKGALKRKREEEEKEQFVNNQMNKRIKRLKKLLQLNKPEEDTQKRKQEDLNEEKNDSLNCIEVSPKPDVLNDEDNKNESEKKEIIKIKMFTPKSKRKSSKLSLKQKDDTSETPKRGKKNKKHQEEIIDVESVEQTEEITVTNDKLKDEIIVDVKLIDVEPIIKSNTQEESVVRTPKRNRKQKETLQASKPKEIGKIEEVSASARPKRQKKLTEKAKNQDILEIDEDSNDSIRPRRTRKKIDYFEETSLDSAPTTPRSKSKATIWNLDSDEEQERTNAKKRNSKIAPVFLKATPKPKLDPEVAEARRQFLMSGIPDSLKKVREKQQRVQESMDYFDVFPKIQHVQQKCESPFWTLPKPDLQYKTLSPLKNQSNIVCNDLIIKQNTKKKIQVPVEEKITKYKQYVDEIKQQNPNYPVYKTFRQILEKSGYKTLQTDEKKTKKRRSKSKRKSVEIVDTTKTIDPKNYAMWTEKFKPECAEDILGNSSAITKLKNYLETWRQFSKEIISRKKKKRLDSTSESEFETTDGDSRDSTRLPGTVFILSGPPGSGKTSAVYAICQELDFKVLEINASSKRTGKKLLQDMHEATQSHQVKNQTGSMQNFLKQTEQPKDAKTKMCLILIEDVDLIFDQDDGFIPALNQLITATKRPIIMTTTDVNSVYAQKYVALYETVNFLPLTSFVLSTWLRLVCLVEGYLVDQDTLSMLLEVNRGDARKTLLQLQFWLQSGGQLHEINKTVIKIKDNRRSLEFDVHDDNSNLNLDEETVSKEQRYVHSYILHSCDDLIPYKLSLGIVWWNLPALLSLPENNDDRLNRFKNFPKVEEKINFECTKNKDLKELKLVAKFYRLHDNLAYADEVYSKFGFNNDFEPCLKNNMPKVKDSLELDECKTEYNDSIETITDLTHTLINESFRRYGNDRKYYLNTSLPTPTEKRWRVKNFICEDILREAIPRGVQKKSLAVDYLPNLRTIARSEYQRSLTNTKRGNRFRHYLKSMDVNLTEVRSKLVCNVLVSDD